MAQELNRNTSLTIGTDSIIISNEPNFPKEERKVISIINTSTAGQVITVGIGDMSAVNQGIVLSVGGYYHESHDAGFTPTQSHISAISSAAAGQISIQERRLIR